MPGFDDIKIVNFEAKKPLPRLAKNDDRTAQLSGITPLPLLDDKPLAITKQPWNILDREMPESGDRPMIVALYDKIAWPPLVPLYRPMVVLDKKDKKEKKEKKKKKDKKNSKKSKKDKTIVDLS